MKQFEKGMAGEKGRSGGGIPKMDCGRALSESAKGFGKDHSKSGGKDGKGSKSKGKGNDGNYYGGSDYYGGKDSACDYYGDSRRDYRSREDDYDSSWNESWSDGRQRDSWNDHSYANDFVKGAPKGGSKGQQVNGEQWNQSDGSSMINKAQKLIQLMALAKAKGVSPDPQLLARMATKLAAGSSSSTNRSPNLPESEIPNSVPSSMPMMNPQEMMVKLSAMMPGLPSGQNLKQNHDAPSPKHAPTFAPSSAYALPKVSQPPVREVTRPDEIRKSPASKPKQVAASIFKRPELKREVVEKLEKKEEEKRKEEQQKGLTGLMAAYSDEDSEESEQDMDISDSEPPDVQNAVSEPVPAPVLDVQTASNGDLPTPADNKAMMEHLMKMQMQMFGKP